MGCIEECAALKGVVFKQFTLGQSKYIREFGSSIEYHFLGN